MFQFEGKLYDFIKQKNRTKQKTKVFTKIFQVVNIQIKETSSTVY